MAQPVERRYYTPEEYFALEERAECRSEYIDGEIFAMAGGTANHNRITTDTVLALHSKLENKGCETFIHDLRVQLQANRRYSYPDVVIVCGKLEFVKNRKDTITNPLVIIEVLSDSTKDYDRGSKFAAYREIQTLREYILIEQDRVHIESFVKEEDGTWRLRDYDDVTSALPFTSLDSAIPIQTIYRRVTSEPQLARVKETGETYGHDNQ
jgi:Uma2 family endonuclease